MPSPRKIANVSTAADRPIPSRWGIANASHRATHAAPASSTQAEETLRHVTWIVVVALAVFVLGLGNSRFWDQDEGYYASVAYEMFQRGDWIVPTFNHELFAHKPPMMYWGMMASFSLFGPSEFAARLVSALLGVGSALLTYALGRRLFDATTGWIAGIAMATCLMFSIVARSATADAYLSFFVLLALYLWARDAISSEQVAAPKLNAAPDNENALPENPSSLGVRTQTWGWVYFAIGLAVMSKGPIGCCFPVTILGLVHWLAPHWNATTGKTTESARWLERISVCMRPSSIVQAILALRPVLGILIVGLVCAPWFLAMQNITHGAFLSEFLGIHHVHRFSQPMDNHGGPIYYYLLACLVGLYPWTAFAMPTLWQWARGPQWTDRPRATLLVSAWASVYLFVFSIASTKLPSYVIPAYPALALIAAHYIAGWRSYQRPSDRVWQLVGWACMGLVGLILIAGPWMLTWPTDSGTWMDRLELDRQAQQTIRWVSVLGIPLLLGGGFGWWMRVRNRVRPMIVGYVATALAMMLLFWQILVPLADQHQTPQEVAGWLRTAREHGPTKSVAVLSYFRPSMVYYSGGPVRFCTSPEELLHSIAADPRSILVVSDAAFESLHAQLPPEYRIVERYPSFPQKGNMLILSSETITR